MKLEEKIEYYASNMEDDNIKSEAIIFAEKLRKKGVILMLLGIIITTLATIAFITLSVIFLVKREISFYQFIPFGIMILFSIPLYIGVYFRKLSQILLEN